VKSARGKHARQARDEIFAALRADDFTFGRRRVFGGRGKASVLARLCGG
jgi:hypothetical protein